MPKWDKIKPDYPKSVWVSTLAIKSTEKEWSEKEKKEEINISKKNKSNNEKETVL